MIKKLITVLVLVICLFAIWTGLYFIRTTGLDVYAKLILFAVPVLALVLNYFFWLGKISVWFLMLPFALAYILSAYR